MIQLIYKLRNLLFLYAFIILLTDLESRLANMAKALAASLFYKRPNKVSVGEAERASTE